MELPLDLKPRESDSERLVKIEAQRKGEGNALGQAEFPHPEKFLRVQTWALLWGTLKRDPTEGLSEGTKRRQNRGVVTGTWDLGTGEESQVVSPKHCIREN